MATKARSPNYPQIGLSKAIELAGKLYQKAHTYKASAEVIVSTFGYGGLNGKSLGVISALKKYGLLESVGGSEFKISKDALTILVDPKSSTDRAQAILRCAYRPSLFAELRQEYGDKPPAGDEFLRAFLLKRGFVQSVVDSAIRAYRDTIACVHEASELLGGGTQQVAFEEEEEEEENEVVTEHQQQPAGKAALAPADPPPSAPALTDTQDDVYKLPDGRAFVLRWPSKISADEFEDFEAWITLLQRKLKRQIEQ